MAANVLQQSASRSDERVCRSRFLEDASFARGQTRVGTKTRPRWEQELKKRLDVHEAVIVTILQGVMDIIDPPAMPQPPKPRIGFTP